MTVIAFDGKTLAADKQADNGWTKHRTTKIRRAGHFLIGSSGDADAGAALKVWFERGAVEADFPKEAADKNNATLMVVGEEGIRLYQRTPHAIHLEQPRHAIGSGAEAALAAMHCGKTAAEAVEIASLISIGCGMGVDTLTLET